MSELRLNIFGKASGKTVQTWKFADETQLPLLSILEFLRKEKIPIASSCFGEGICKKCVFNGDQLGCQINLKDLFNQSTQAVIEIDYL
jgi:Na+-transporting NADH:ubiquinone oxidoreductase subunit NqrF